jgi:hypothetical protein
MRTVVRLALTAAVATLAVGCTPGTGTSDNPGSSGSPTTSSTATGGPTRAIPTGAGPQRKYTVEAQPAKASCHYRHDKGQPLEDRACTPGALNPDVTQADLATTICRKGGYTADIRPPAYITAKEKRLSAASYGYTGTARDSEYDHLISLQLGGDPNDPRNLWVEPPSPGHRTGAGPNNPKDVVETKLHTAVCRGTIKLAQAQQAIVADWSTALSRLGLT